MIKEAEKLTDIFDSRFAKWNGRDDCNQKFLPYL